MIRMLSGNNMSNATRRSTRAALVVLLLAVIVAVTASWRGSHAQVQPPSEARTTLHSTGFDPAHVTCAAGHIKLAVANESGTDGLTLRMKRMGGDVVREDQMPAGSSEWTGEYDLSAGNYVLSEVNNPAWLFYVTVQ